MTERRNNHREGRDRRRETRGETPLWGFVAAVILTIVVLAAFWSLVY
ncbi:MAG: type VI protein secretion system component VasF [Halieaceae bacterium]|jgi:type VI protein secretion system component VasF